MKIDAKVQSISKLKDYFFLVPDYQREYVWKPDDEVEQFLRGFDELEQKLIYINIIRKITS